MTGADLARVIGVDRAAITGWRKGAMPRRDKIAKIETWSGGTIRAADWFAPANDELPLADDEPPLARFAAQ
jgi:transcriptional regulator with XRE-family HTH domain